MSPGLCNQSARCGQTPAKAGSELPIVVLLGCLSILAAGCRGLCDQAEDVQESCADVPWTKEDEQTCQAMLERCTEEEKKHWQAFYDCVEENAGCHDGRVVDRQAQNACLEHVAEGVSPECSLSGF